MLKKGERLILMLIFANRLLCDRKRKLCIPYFYCADIINEKLKTSLKVIAVHAQKFFFSPLM